MRILFLIPIVFLSLLIAPAAVKPAFSFEVDMGEEEIYRLEAKFLLKDLSVGDKLTVDPWDFCVVGNKLAIWDFIYGTSKSDYRPSFILTLLPSSKASLEVKPDNRKGLKFALSLMLPKTYETCEEDKVGYKFPSEIIFIKTINGFGNLSDYVNHLKENGHEIVKIDQ